MKWFKGSNPYTQGSLIYNRDFTLYKPKDSRETNAASKEASVDIQDFVGAEPQMMQRATENLVLLEDISAMQNSLFVIYTQETFEEIEKGMRILDIDTEKRYRVMGYYTHVDGVDFVTSEMSD